MSEPFIGEIRMFAGRRAPIDWAFCDGQLQSISENQALFSLIGNSYGGDGWNTFRLPDLRGRMPVGTNSTSGGQPQYQIGKTGGLETVALVTQEIPGHTHTLPASSSRATPGATGGFANTGGTPVYGLSGGERVNLRADTITAAGTGEPHNNMPPYLCINFIIALQGIYPTRD